MEKLFKFEFSPQVVQYLLRALDSQQIRGEQQAKDLLQVKELLRNPLNKEDLEKEALEDLKAKYEPLQEEKSKDKK